MTPQEPLAALPPAAAAVLEGDPRAAAASAERLDEATFRALYAATARPLWAYLMGASGDPALAEDLAQESYFWVLRAEGAPRDPLHFRGYLFCTAANLLRDHRRWRCRCPEVALEETSAAARGGQGWDQDQTDLRGDLARFLARLEPRARQLLWLAHVEGWSHADLAAALGLKEASVRVLLFRARQRLAALLRAHGYTPERCQR